MSATNKTQHYNLPQFVAGDIPAWMTDVNNAMATIDGAIYDVASDEATVGERVAQLGSRVTTAENKVASLGTTVQEVQGDVAENTADIDTLEGNVNGLGTRVTTVEGKVTALEGETAEDIPYDNTDSGLTATDVQSAIDEIAQSGGGDGSVRYNNGYIQYTPDGGTTWVNLINTSSPLQLLPVMTSPTSATGSVTSSGVTGTPYYAIDGSAEANNAPRFPSQGDNITFTFTDATFVKYISTTYINDSTVDSEIRLDWSVDGNTWNSGTTVAVDADDTNEHNITQNINATVKAIRIYKTVSSGAFKAYKFEAYN